MFLGFKSGKEVSQQGFIRAVWEIIQNSSRKQIKWTFLKKIFLHCLVSLSVRLFGFPLPLPFLFSLYIIDIEKHLIENKISGLESFSNDIDDDLCIFMKLLIFFNAADTVILSETPSNLQYALNECFEYCETWKLYVNVKKNCHIF